MVKIFLFDFLWLVRAPLRHARLKQDSEQRACPLVAYLAQGLKLLMKRPPYEGGVVFKTVWKEIDVLRSRQA